jgi:hypothetical protein
MRNVTRDAVSTPGKALMVLCWGWIDVILIINNSFIEIRQVIYCKSINSGQRPKRGAFREQRQEGCREVRGEESRRCVALAGPGTNFYDGTSQAK